MTNIAKKLILFVTFCIMLSSVLGQATVPDEENYIDDLSFLDVAVDRGENAILCVRIVAPTHAIS
jgi:hypothetical protein